MLLLDDSDDGLVLLKASLRAYFGIDSDAILYQLGKLGNLSNTGGRGIYCDKEAFDDPTAKAILEQIFVGSGITNPQGGLWYFVDTESDMGVNQIDLVTAGVMSAGATLIYVNTPNALQKLLSINEPFAAPEKSGLALALMVHQ